MPLVSHPWQREWHDCKHCPRRFVRHRVMLLGKLSSVFNVQALAVLMRASTGEAANECTDATSRLQWLQSCVSTEARLAISAAGALVAMLVKVGTYCCIHLCTGLAHDVRCGGGTASGAAFGCAQRKPERARRAGERRSGV